jgi:hypothetical protein
MKILESSIIIPIIFVIIFSTFIIIVSWSAQLQQLFFNEIVKLSQHSSNHQVTLIRVTDLLIESASKWMPRK